MANSMPWSVRGIDPDIREQAVEAAHRSGLSVGQWLNQILAGSIDEDEAEEDLPPRSRRSTRRRAARNEPDRQSEYRLAELGDRLSRFGQRRTSTAAHRFSHEDDDAPVIDLLQEAVDAIERIEKRQVATTPARTSAKSAALDDNLRAFEAKLDRLLSAREAEPAPSAAPAPANDALERRLAGIMQTLERMHAATALPVVPAATGHAARFADEDPAFARALAEIETRRRNLDADQTPRARAAASGEAPRPAAQDAMLGAMRAELAKLTSRIEDMRAPTGAADEVSAVRRELAQVSASLEQLSPQRLVGLVEHAVSGLADKMVREPHAGLPVNLSEPLERVHEDVRAVLREVSEARGTELLSREVGNIARRLDAISAASSPAQIEQIAVETSAIKQLVSQAMRAQPLEGLAHQIEQLSRQVERSQNNPAARDDRALLDAIRDVSDRIERLDPRASFAGLESRLSAITSLENRLSAVSGIEEKLGEIVLGMKKLAKDAQPLPKLDSISERLERIDRALDNPKASPLAGIDQLTARLDKIGSTLDKVSNAPTKGGNDDALLSLMERLSQRMEQVAGHANDSRALDQLQGEIAGLARSMEKSGKSNAGLDSIERAVSDLFSQFDQTRQDMRNMAESAAVRAAEEALKAGGGRGDTQSDALAAEGLLLLKRDLNDFKSTQSEAEARTRQTLEQVQSTLGLLMKRLSEAEVPARAPMASPAQTPVHAPAPAAPVPPKPDFTAKVEAAARAEMAARQDFVAERAPQRAPSMPDGLDLPLEPGMEPGAAPAPSHTSTPMAAAAALEAGMPADPRANFIAAARRAAQAAAEKSQAALEQKDTDTKGKRPAMRLAGGKDAAGKEGNGTSIIVRARKPILLGLAAIVFSMGALKVMSSRNQAMIMAPAGAPSSTVQPGGNANPAMPRKSEEIETTGSLGEGEQQRTSETQPIPGVNAPSIGEPHFNTKLNKRGQRLADTSSLTQTDPMTVGSLGQDGSAKPIDTTRSGLADLANSSNLKGMENLREVALKGNAAAIFEIGSRFADGKGVTRDPRLAARWFEQAAAQGHGPSQYRLGSLYREGRGIPKDSNLAFQWFDRAAAQGHVLAMHNAAVLLAEGVHGTPDYAGAALWFKRAAEFGIKDSQFNVAILYARGLGVNQDLAESYRWFSIAANQGDMDAGKKRDDIAARLTKEQLASENERVKTFKPNKPNAGANDAGNWESVAKRS